MGSYRLSSGCDELECKSVESEKNSPYVEDPPFYRPGGLLTVEAIVFLKKWKDYRPHRSGLPAL